ncbi:MAG: VanW family protein [Pseudonocardiales bacterium]
MTDKSAQDEPRAWLEEPPRADGAAGEPGEQTEDVYAAGAVTDEIPRIQPARPQPARPLRRGGIAAAIVLVLLVLVYGIDLAMSRGEVPRGVTVAGVDVGGLDRVGAEQRLREQIEPRLTQPVPVRAGDVDVTLDPGQAGLMLDWPGTLDQAGQQPLNPWTRLTSLFTVREVGVVTSGNRDAVLAALQGLLPQIDRPAAEGTIRFEGAQPVPVDPVPGQRLNLAAATDTLLAEWARGGAVQVPVETLPVSTTSDGIRAALRDVVEPAVSGPVTVPGEGTEAVLTPEVTAAALRFVPDGRGGLTTTVDNPTVIDALAPQLAGTERVAKNAGIVMEGGRPVVRPSTEGRRIDWEKSLLTLPDVLRVVGVERTLPAVYLIEAPKLSTVQAGALGITTEISTFTTGGFAVDSGRNIRRAAEEVNGAIVAPGETFSLNGYTGPRNAASGYQEAGIIDHGRPARGIGGGVSQFATTLYNASYFAGMVDVEHKEHSYYISRYPAGREATVFEGAIDVKFRNDSPTGILIQTGWSPTSLTVTFWGTKHVKVESITGPRTNYTDPETRRISAEDCTGTSGSRGFTVTDTRVIRNASTNAEISRQTRKVVYKPQPRIICE